jgi:hypothetical protein
MEFPIVLMEKRFNFPFLPKWLIFFEKTLLEYSLSFHVDRTISWFIKMEFWIWFLYLDYGKWYWLMWLSYQRRKRLMVSFHVSLNRGSSKRKFRKMSNKEAWHWIIHFWHDSESFNVIQKDRIPTLIFQDYHQEVIHV